MEQLVTQKRSFYLVLIGLTLLLFFVNYLPREPHMPQHVDAWIILSKAKEMVAQESLLDTEPFAGGVMSYPDGSYVHLGVLNVVTGVDLILLSQILPSIFLILLGYLLYSLSHSLFGNKKLSLCVLAFTPLSLSNITILGPYYLVPIVWGMLLMLLFFYLISKEKYMISALVFIGLSITHTSSALLAIIGVTLYMLFNKKMWSKLKYLLGMYILGVILYLLTRGMHISSSFFDNFLTFSSRYPYVYTNNVIPTIFLILVGVGYFFIFRREYEKKRFLIPLFTFLIINLLLYWYWRGVLIVYRRLFTFLFMLFPIFVGYAIYKIGDLVKKMPTSKFKIIKKYPIVLAMLVLLLLPLAIQTNIESHENNYVYITAQEHNLLSKFGEEYPNTQLLGGYLESYAFPYYGLIPVQLSPMHGIDSKYYSEINKCYWRTDIDCIADFMESKNISYIYPRREISNDNFIVVLEVDSRRIYKYQNS